MLVSGTFIPPALSTVIAFSALGLALLGMARRLHAAFGSPNGDSPRPNSAFFPILIFLMAGIIATGYAIYRHYAKQYEAGLNRELSAIAALKADELAQWRMERLGDGKVFLQNPTFAALVRRAFGQPPDLDAQQQIRGWLDCARNSLSQYSRIVLVDTQGVERLSVPVKRAPPICFSIRDVATVLQSGRAQILDFQRDSPSRSVRLNILVPIFDTLDANHPLGVLALRVDPKTYLYPFIQRWPTPTQTGEILLLRRDGNNVLYLNDLRHQSNAAFALCLPVGQSEDPAARACLGQTGGMRGVDYRGVPVLAHACEVPNSPWFLVVKVDIAEVYAPLRERFWHQLFLVGALLVATGTYAGLHWRREYIRFYRERAEAAEALQVSETKFRNLFNNAEVGMFRMRFDGSEVLDINDKYLSILGRTREETIGKPSQILWADPKAREAMVQKLINNGRIDDLECQLITKEGKVITCLTSSRLYPEQGILEGSILDITARKQAEEELQQQSALRDLLMTMSATYINLPVQAIEDAIRDSLEELAVFVEADRACVFVYDFDKQISCNTHEWCADGIEPQIARLQAVPLALAPASVEAHRRGDPVHVPDVSALPPGARRDFLEAQKIKSLLSVPFTIAGKCVGFVGFDWVKKMHVWSETETRLLMFFARMLASVRQRQQAEEILRESESRFASIFHNVPVAIAISRFKSDTIIDANDAFFALFAGHARKEIIGSSFHALNIWARSEDRDRMDMLLRQMGRTTVFETQFRRNSGELRDVIFMAELVDLAGEKCVLGVANDITEHKHAEEEQTKLRSLLAQAQKMESVGRLAGGVAHDFNNLLMVIMGNAELCRQTIDPGHPGHEWLNEIIQSVKRSATLTRQLLAYARKQIIAPRILDLNSAISDMLKLLQRLIGEDVAIVWRPGTALWPVKMDPSQVDQILTNLAVNARDAICGVGSIVIETGNITVDQSYCVQHPDATPGHYVMLQFSDTGCGIDPEIRAHLFEPFFTTKEDGKGTGLGLATVYGIVKQNNGWIAVDSQPGQGTRFTIYWPRDIAPNAPRATKETPAAVIGGHSTILLVEDEAPVRAVTHSFLKGLGYTVLVAENPEQALRLAAQHPGEIHLLLTDVIMPGMNGKELSRRLSEIRPTVKCLFISGFTADVLAQRGVAEDSLEFLSKPFSREELARKIRKVLDASPG